MDSNGALALFNQSHREMRGTQVHANDLVPFQKGRKLKVPGTALNAVGALIQLVAEQAGNSDFAIFSSWLSPLISKKVAQGKIYGTVLGLIQEACQGAPLEILLAKRLWIFPMYGSDPPHWILGYIEPGPRRYHIFDSMPELNNFSWAEPALLELGDTVYATLGPATVDWEIWKRVLHSPPELERQMNGWACGFFVIHGMTALADGSGIETVVNSETERVREGALKLTVANSSRRLFEPTVHAPTKNDELVMDTKPQPPTPSLLSHDIEMGDELAEHAAVLLSLDEDMTDTHGDESSISKRKKEQPANTRELKKPRKAALTKPADRERTLKGNIYIQTVEPHRVHCARCLNWIALDNKVEFKTANWDRHEAKCPGIVGLALVRSAVVAKKIKPVSAFTPSIATIFAAGPIQSHPPARKRVCAAPPEPRSCLHLSGDNYIEYIERTETRAMGGISPTLRGRVARQIFMHKKFAMLKSGEDQQKLRKKLELDVPQDGNKYIQSSDWTEAEQVQLYEGLKGYARWEVNYVRKFVRSTHCGRLTANPDGICDACKKLAHDESFLRSIRRKNAEAKLPIKEQHEILMARNKYSSRRFLTDEARTLDDKLKDPLVFKSFKLLQKGESTECFIQLYDACLNGELEKHQTFKQLCGVLADVLQREGTNKKFGVRYPKDYLNFMILLRSYGGQSARQYGIIAGEFPAPSARHLRTLVSKSEDALQNPYLIYQNVARVKRLVDTIKYTGPVAVAGDCTKVRKRLTYSHDFGGHILGSVLPFEQCMVEDPDQIDAVIVKITKAKAAAIQVRAILVKVPLPHIPPQVIALIPTDGKDDAKKILELHLKLLKMAAELTLPVISFAADGAASELSAQNTFDKLTSDFPPLTYSYALYGIHLRTPVFATGPAVAITDPSHASKTGRNQPQHGTHTASMGKGKVVNNDFVQLQRTGEAGLLKSDVFNADKQDDGPARRLWHHHALLACTIEDEEGMKIKPGFDGLFVYLFVFGVLFDAWLNRTMTVANRVLAVLRARFWLHFWRAHIVQMSIKYPDLYSTARSFISPASFHIFNRLCDSLLLLVVIYARYYPGQPFCPWLMGTEFVEHFFGLARMMLPNFTYAEFLKMVQHMAVRQRILLSGQFKEKRERTANVGYVLDFDASPLTAEDRKLAEVKLTDSDINALVELAFDEAALICTQLMHIPATRPTRERPVALTALGAPMPKGKQAAADASESESDFDPDEEELDDEDVPDPPAGDGESRVVTLAAHDTARYSALCDDYENALEEAESDPVVFGPPSPASDPVSSGATEQPGIESPTFKSEIIDGHGKLSIALMVQARLHWQAGTTTRSQKTLQIDSKYALSRISRGMGHGGNDDTEPERMTQQEASQRVRIAQDSNSELQDSKPRKAREQRWKTAAATLQKLVNANGELLFPISAKNVHALNPLSVGTFCFMWNGVRFYIGEILDVYKKGASSRYGSIEDSQTASGLSYLSLRVYLALGTGVTTNATAEVEDDDRPADEIVAPLFSSHERSAHIYTHARSEHLIFHLGRDIFRDSGDGEHRTLSKHAAVRWNTLTKPGPVERTVRKVILKIREP
ncbi:hypothetical protein GGX14DRAFT_359779 [Mycena pura]|uniref:Ubiquitin-like protease family profile domain-containing protein n=1 Tax=Mycena pura TaxID=153505 RepID=A0AAD6UXY8_9AGAR|nr:hypothetical protein GGX14DRAFT_377644 [Mycena pura]KAJ7199142.1 hypothetical protein GGX14DRAFT_373263 [Mycena pura]KAJ7215036.1 hypothetical protein GGX14DRAFT_359779 [Mycena pura]